MSTADGALLAAPQPSESNSSDTIDSAPRIYHGVQLVSKCRTANGKWVSIAELEWDDKRRRQLEDFEKKIKEQPKSLIHKAPPQCTAPGCENVKISIWQKYNEHRLQHLCPEKCPAVACEYNRIGFKSKSDLGKHLATPHLECKLCGSIQMRPRRGVAIYGNTFTKSNSFASHFQICFPEYVREWMFLNSWEYSKYFNDVDADGSPWVAKRIFCPHETCNRHKRKPFERKDNLYQHRRLVHKETIVVKRKISNRGSVAAAAPRKKRAVKNTPSPLEEGLEASVEHILDDATMGDFWDF